MDKSACDGKRTEDGCANSFEKRNYQLIDEAVVLKVRIDVLSEANGALVCALDRIQDVLRGAYVDDVALVVNNALAKNKEALCQTQNATEA